VANSDIVAKQAFCILT